MLINRIINVEEDFDSGGVAEPVTLLQVKEYLRLGGFVPDDSGEQEFDYDDTLIETMITEARQWLEKYTGQYIVPRELSVDFQNQAGMQPLPGPVEGSIVFADTEDVVLTPVVIGALFPKVETKYTCRLKAVYQVGYNEFPPWVKNSILAYLAWAYENRGDQQAGSPERAAAIARPHRRVIAWG